VFAGEWARQLKSCAVSHALFDLWYQHVYSGGHS
jgi:hypothetical protein